MKQLALVYLSIAAISACNPAKKNSYDTKAKPLAAMDSAAIVQNKPGISYSSDVSPDEQISDSLIKVEIRTPSNDTDAMRNANPGGTNDTVPLTKGEIIPLIVEFYSIGEGVKAGPKQVLDKFVAGKERQLAKTIKYQVVPWGREGEYDACFRLSQLTFAERKTFIKDIKKIFDPKALVHVLENQACRHIR